MICWLNSRAEFGIHGLRELVGIKERRPLSLHIIKPKMGMTPKQVGEQCYQTAIGGADMMKDDEMTSDVITRNLPIGLLVREALHKAKEKTGRMPIYLCSVTDEASKVHAGPANWWRSAATAS